MFSSFGQTICEMLMGTVALSRYPGSVYLQTYSLNLLFFWAKKPFQTCSIPSKAFGVMLKRWHLGLGFVQGGRRAGQQPWEVSQAAGTWQDLGANANGRGNRPGGGKCRWDVMCGYRFSVWNSLFHPYCAQFLSIPTHGSGKHEQVIAWIWWKQFRVLQKE